MFEIFEAHITANGLFTADELRQIRSLAIARKLRKKQLLLHEGDVCRYKAFVVKGLAITYNTSNDGAEHIMRFSAENEWAVDADSYNNQVPSKFNIEAIEDTELVMWNKEDLDMLFAAIPAFKEYSISLIAKVLKATQERVLINISATPEEKYNRFIETFPDIFRRVPLHMVASYLGVSRETLSRVRHAMVKG